MYSQQSKTNNLFLYIFCIIILCNLFFGYAFQLLLIFNFPVNEITLLFFLLFINYFLIFNKLNTITNIFPFLIWIAYGLIGIFFSFIEQGIWALRDGSQIFDSLYLVVGFLLISNERNIKFFFRIIKIAFFVGLVYAFLFPFKDFLVNLPPIITSVAGVGAPVSFFFNYSALSLTWVWLGFYPLILSNGFRSNFIFKIAPIIMIGMSLFMMQRRMIYIGVIAALFFLNFYARQSFKKATVYIFLLFLLLYLISFFGLKFEGQVGSPNIAFFFKHLISFLPGFQEANPDFATPAGTAEIRRLWWGQVIEKSFSSLKFFFFGQGYGSELVTFRIAHEILVREPHNTFISMYARMGLLGLLIWLWMHIVLFKTWVKFYKYTVSNNLTIARNRLLYLAIFLVMILGGSIGASLFQTPYYAVPYYFFWGAILGICYNLNNNLNKIDQNEI